LTGKSVLGKLAFESDLELVPLEVWALPTIREAPPKKGKRD